MIARYPSPLSAQFEVSVSGLDERHTNHARDSGGHAHAMDMLSQYIRKIETW